MCGAIDKLVSTTVPWKADKHTWSKEYFTIVVDQCYFAAQDKNAFVLHGMAMKQRRHGARRKCHMIHPKTLQPKQIP